MAWQFDPNNLVTGASDSCGTAWFLFKNLAVGSWNVVGTGDGAAAFENEDDATGGGGGGGGGIWDVFTQVSTWGTGSALALGHINAWVRFKEQGSTREIMMQRHNNASASFENDITVAFSPTGFDDTGVASATVVPTASALDQVFWSGTAFAGGTAAWGPNTSTDTRISIGVEDTPQDGVYPFYIMARKASGGTRDAMLLYEAVEEADAGDLQPWFVFCPNGDSSLTELTFIETADTIGYYIDYGGGGQIWLPPKGTNAGSFYGLRDGDGDRMSPGFCGTQIDGDARIFQVIIGRSAITNYKGICRNIQWKATDARDFPDTKNLATANAKAYVDDVLLPWEQNTVPLP